MKEQKRKIIVVLLIILLLVFGTIFIITRKNNKTENTDNVEISNNEESYVVKKNEENKYGIVDSSGKTIIPFEYDEGYDYCNGVAVLTNEKGSTYFNSSGGIIGFPNRALDGPANTYTEDDYLASKDTDTGLYGFINKEGVLILPYEWKYVNNFYNGLALVGNDNGTYVIDKYRNEIIKPEVLSKYSSINPVFEHELLVVSKDDQSYGVIDITGKEIIRCKTENKSIEITNENIEVHTDSNIDKYDFKGKKIEN